MPLSAAEPQQAGRRRSLAALALGALLCASSLLAAQPAGDVVFVQGIASAQKPGEAPRFIQKGDVLSEGDIVNTGVRGFAVVELLDGSKMTLRPDTSFAIDKFRQGTGDDGLLLRLLKGGMRTATGLIAKRNPRSVRVNAATATIGIRGTSFDARICGRECAQEGRGAGQQPAISLAQQEATVARIAVAFGQVSLVSADGQARAAVKGAPLFSGETVRTQKDAYAVVAFRDRSLVTVIADSEFRLENVRFSIAQPAGDSFAVRIIKGGARTLTGLLAKRDPKTVRIHIGTATVGIRGTGVDGKFALDCIAGACNESAFVYTWEGTTACEVGARSLRVEKDRACVHDPARDRLLILDRVPEFFFTETAPRPDRLTVDFDNLFGTAGIEGNPAGLYVLVREGHVELAGAGGAIDLGPGDSGYLGEGRTVPVRLTVTPTFMLFDPFPLPDRFDPNSVRLIDILNMGGRAGDLICEI